VVGRLREITSSPTLPASRRASRIIWPASRGSLIRLPAQERDKGRTFAAMTGGAYPSPRLPKGMEQPSRA